MNKLKDKFESYTVSTLEENQRERLLDDLARSAEIVNDFADQNEKTNGTKDIDDEQCVTELCNCILDVLSHELKAINDAGKPSFWFVAEGISPKDTVKMIYRLRIRQSDAARCKVWIKHSLVEGTIGSYFSVLKEDFKILRQNYKSTAFVRDSKNMESAKSLIEHLISSVHFNIEIEGISGIDTNQPFFGSYPSKSTFIKDRESPNNVVIIQESPSSSYTDSHISKKKKQSQIDTMSLPGDFLRGNIIYRPNELLTEQVNEVIPKECSPSNMSHYLNSPMCNKKYGSSPRLTVSEMLQRGSSPSGHLEVSDSSDNSLSSSVDSLRNGCINKNNVIVNMIKVVSDTIGSLKSAESTLNILVKETTISGDKATQKHISSPLSKLSMVSTGGIFSPKNLDNSNKIGPTLNEPKQLSLSARIEAESSHNTNIESLNKEVGSDICGLNICGSLNPSENSAFDVVNIVDTESVVFKGDVSGGDGKEDNESTSNQHSDHSLSDSVEEEYRNQDNEFQTMPLEGSSQLSNVLSNVSVPVSSSGDYLVPGIHSCDILSTQDSQPEVIKVLNSSTTVCVLPGTSPKVKSNSDNSYSSPSTLSTLSAKLFEKTLFGKTLGSSFSSDVGSNEAHSVSDSESECSVGQSFSMLVELGVNEDFIGIEEDHFSTPDTFMGFSSFEELENAISSCKQLINSSPEKSKRRDELVTQLVQLRLKLHELKDAEPVPRDGKKVLGHQFFKQGSMATSTLECDACAVTIFPLLQKVFVCKDCGFHCHEKCLNILEKPCVHSKKLVNSSCELRICPEISLAAQQYRCADCFKRIPVYDEQFEVRLCDYTGQKYCSKCHWNDMCVIPARVVHNWDFSLHCVSRQSKHLLLLLLKKPDIKLQAINSILFNFVDELRDVRTFRQQIMMMKKYMVSCRVATEERLLLLLQNRQHFVDNSDVYSLQDLLDVQNNVLLNELSHIHATFGKHIKFDCLLCQGKGYICEFCNAEEIIFPFDNHVTWCVCKGVFHRLCYSQHLCPKCIRTKNKKIPDDIMEVSFEIL